MVVTIVDVIQSIIDGILYGSIYALIGVGFTLIFGAMQKLNMAYAASSIAGAYCGLGISTLLSLSLFITFLVCVKQELRQYQKFIEKKIKI